MLGQNNPRRCVVLLYVGASSNREQCHLLSSWPAFSHFLCYPQANWAFLVQIPRWLGSCTFQDPLGLSNELSCEAGSFCHQRNPCRFLQPEVLRLSFPMLEPWVAWSVSLPSCSSWFICMQMWDHPLCWLLPTPVLQQLPCCESSPPQLPVSTTPASLGKYFFFNSLVARLP